LFWGRREEIWMSNGIQLTLCIFLHLRDFYRGIVIGGKGRHKYECIFGIYGKGTWGMQINLYINHANHVGFGMVIPQKKIKEKKNMHAYKQTLPRFFQLPKVIGLHGMD
jgi:hypothetical protein